MNVNKILFPTDYSANSSAVLEYATSLARDLGARLLIVHVAETPAAYGPGAAELYGVPQPEENELQAMLERVLPTDAQVPHEHHLLHGAAATAIRDFAEQQEVDLIVMGTHGRTGLTRLLMGSIAESVMRHAPCPVLTLNLSHLGGQQEEESAGTR